MSWAGIAALYVQHAFNTELTVDIRHALDMWEGSLNVSDVVRIF